MFVSYHIFYTKQEFDEFVAFLQNRHIPYGLYPMQLPDRLRYLKPYTAMRLVLYRVEDHDEIIATFGSDDLSS